MMIIMESLETMLSDAVNITSILNISDAKFHKFRQLKKQMSNISPPTPSPAGSPDPSDLIGLDNDEVSQTVLKTINTIGEADKIEMVVEAEESLEDLSGTLDTPVTIGAEFFPSASSSCCSSSVTSVTLSAVQSSSSQLTCLTSSSGKNRNPLSFLAS